MKTAVVITLLAIGIAHADDALLTSSVLRVVGTVPINISAPSQGTRRVSAGGKAGEVRETSTGLSITWDGKIHQVSSSSRPTNVQETGNGYFIRQGPRLYVARPSWGGWIIRAPTNREMGLGG
jgi:hypothetical protein